jgi:hypothetical protein
MTDRHRPCSLLQGGKTVDSLAKRRLVRYWVNRRKQMELELIRDRIDNDASFRPYCEKWFEEIKPFWFAAFHEEYPRRHINHYNLHLWLKEQVSLAEQKGKEIERLAWVQQYNFLLGLLCFNILPPRPFEILAYAKS